MTAASNKGNGYFTVPSRMVPEQKVRSRDAEGRRGLESIMADAISFSFKVQCRHLSIA